MTVIDNAGGSSEIIIESVRYQLVTKKILMRIEQLGFEIKEFGVNDIVKSVLTANAFSHEVESCSVSMGGKKVQDFKFS